MRLKIILTLAAISGLILAWDLGRIFLVVPDEASQGAIFRIIYFHVPAAITSFTGFYIAMFSSIGYLMTKDLRFDSVAASINEVSLAFASITLCTGSIWGRVIWGIWWTWDPRLTSFFVCWLIYVGYFMLRRAIDDPTARARAADAGHGPDPHPYAAGSYQTGNRCATPSRACVLRNGYEPTKLHFHVLWFFGRLADRDRLCDLDRSARKETAR
jgi:hypothetical protein